MRPSPLLAHINGYPYPDWYQYNFKQWTLQLFSGEIRLTRLSVPLVVNGVCLCEWLSFSRRDDEIEEVLSLGCVLNHQFNVMLLYWGGEIVKIQLCLFLIFYEITEAQCLDHLRFAIHLSQEMTMRSKTFYWGVGGVVWIPNIISWILFCCCRRAEKINAHFQSTLPCFFWVVIAYFFIYEGWAEIPKNYFIDWGIGFLVLVMVTGRYALLKYFTLYCLVLLMVRAELD